MTGFVELNGTKFLTILKHNKDDNTYISLDGRQYKEYEPFTKNNVPSNIEDNWFEKLDNSIKNSISAICKNGNTYYIDRIHFYNEKDIRPYRGLYNSYKEVTPITKENFNELINLINKNIKK